MAWQPDAGTLSQLAQVLKDAVSPNAKTQKQAEALIEQAKKSPDFTNYLAYLTTHPSANTGLDAQGNNSARSSATIMLKNQIKANYTSIPQHNTAYVKSTILTGLLDNSVSMRSYTGNVIAEIVRQGTILGWPQVLPDLVAIVENSSTTDNARDGALSALFKICEDNRKGLDKEYQTQRPLAFLLPKLLSFTTNPSSSVRSRALSSINVFINEPIALTIKENIDPVLQHLIALTADPSEEVRRYVSRAFALLADGLPAVLLPYTEGIVRYTIAQQNNQRNPELALDAAEFFFEASNSKGDLRERLGPYLPEIVPVLLDCMIYDEEEQQRLEGDDEDADEEDEAKDIKPQFATSKARGTQDSATGNNTANGYAYEDDDLSDGEIYEDEEYGDPEDEWSLRKCSAATLDNLSAHFGSLVFQQTLPWLQANITHKDWPNREAAVLAIGAIGPGTMDAIAEHLPQLIPYIIAQLNDEQPVVRQISCWALSRFSTWAAGLGPADVQQFFEPMMDGILKRMLDKNKRVQESAASAFATVEESAGDAIKPYCAVIVKQFNQCFQRYKDKNRFILYDCVQTLAEYAGNELAKPELVQLLMPALIERWHKVNDQSREMFPLLECLSFVATALGPAFAPFSRPLFDRCIHIMQSNLEDAFSGEAYDLPDKDFLVTSLDLVSAIIQALPSAESGALVDSAKVNMFHLLAYCMRDDSNDVRQSAFALLGDCGCFIVDKLVPYLPDLLPLVVAQLDLSQANTDAETAFRVINNACWSCGEIAMRAGKVAMDPFSDQLLQKLVIILYTENLPESLTENAAVAIGRLGTHCHEQLAIHLDKFAPPFLNSMRLLEWTDEKATAYRGFANIVLDNPKALEQCLLDFFNQIADAPKDILLSMQDSGPRRGFEMVIQTYKGIIPTFDAYINSLGPVEASKLRENYGV